MSTPTLTLRSLKNLATGIEITVPTVQEVEVPFGGTSVEYEVSVLTNLPTYKTLLHQSEDVVHFSVHKSYREIEYLYDKLSLIFKTASLPQIPKGSSALKCSTEEKREALHVLMQFISNNKDLCSSSIFAQFIGINQKQLRSVSSVSTKKEKASSESNRESDDDYILDTKIKSDLKKESNESQNFVNLDNSGTDSFLSDSGLDTITTKSKNVQKKSEFPDIFQKMKIEKSLSQNVTNNVNKNTPSVFLPSVDDQIFSMLLDDDDVDLFKKVKQVKKVQNAETENLDAERKLQDKFEFEDCSSNLFEFTSSAVHNSSSSKSSNVEIVHSKPLKDDGKQETKSKNFVERTPEQVVDVDNKLFQNRKLGNVSLFEEQDLGDFITEEEEPLFLVTKDEKRNANKNSLLSPKSNDNELEQNDVNEAIEDIMDFWKSPVKSENSKKPVTLPAKVEKVEEILPQKPVPKPRRKSLTSTVADPPQVLPKKVFLSKPSLPSKPVPPTKPKLPAKSKMAANIAQNKPSKPESKKFIKSEVDEKANNSNPTGDLSSLDILQYITQEQKISAAEATLFD